MPRSSSPEQSSERHWLFDPRVLIILCTAICIGTYYARAVVSIATALLAVAGLIVIFQKGQLSRLLRDRITMSLVAIAGIYLLSGLNSADTEQWLRRLLTNAPYAILPVAFFAFGPLSRRHLVTIFGVFIAITTVASAAVLFDYLQHYDTYNEMYLRGQTIPTPIIHVRFSFFGAIASLLSFGILAEGHVSRGLRVTLLLTGIFLLVFLHILAVRTGLLALYTGGLVLALVYMFRERKFREAIIGLLALGALLAVAYFTLPSFKNKIGYMRWDIKQMTEHGAAANYSDNVRITSIRHGLELIRAHPLFGVGIGDIESAIGAVYEERTPDFPPERRFPPISQYIFWITAFGIVGALALLLLLLYPLYRLGNRSYLLVALYAATLFSCLAETTLQLQLGKTIFLLLACALIQSYRNDVFIEPVRTANDLAIGNLPES